MQEIHASINIENVVASATLKQTIDLNSVVKAFPGVEYRPEQFPGLVFRLKKPKTATLIFNSGKMVCTGAKSEQQAKKAVRKVVQELKNNGILISSPLRLLAARSTWRNPRTLYVGRCTSRSSFPV
jgi:transcription initiation factor TFIID TATA-box-binding protein